MNTRLVLTTAGQTELNLPDPHLWRCEHCGFWWEWAQEACTLCQGKRGESLAIPAVQRNPLEKALNQLLCGIEEQYPEMVSSILLLDGDGKHVHHAAAPRLPASFTNAIDGAPIGPCAGSCGTAAYRGQPVVVEDIATDALWNQYRDLALQHELRACWSTPIFHENGDRVLGTFALYFRTRKAPTRMHSEIIRKATHTASVLLSCQVQ